MKLTVLGSGTPEAYARRASSGYLIETGADKILFDCGGGVFDNLLRAGLPPSDITHIVFSHLHSDHMMDYARLVHAAWDEGGAPIRVYGPAPIRAITDGYFGPNGVLSHDLRARTELEPSKEVWVARGGTLPRPWPEADITEIAPGDVVVGDTWTIRSCTVPHAQPALTCMAFALEADGKRFVYSGDAGLCPELEALAQGADLLLHWCYRMDGAEASPGMAAMTPTPSELGTLARRVGAKRLLLTHIRKRMDEPSAHAAAQRGASDAFGQDVQLAEDLMVADI